MAKKRKKNSRRKIQKSKTPKITKTTRFATCYSERFLEGAFQSDFIPNGCKTKRR